MGQNTYLALAPLLSNLISPRSYIPSLADVAKHMHSYLRLSFDGYRQGESPQPFEIGLFGYCSKTSKLSMFHYTIKLEDDGVCRVTCEPHENMQDKEFIYLGDKKTLMYAKISAAFAGESIPGRPLSRIPRYVIQDHIDDPEFLSIGGDLQLGIADRFGFRPFMLCKPRVTGQPAALISYLGRELTPEIANVGEAEVGGPAIV